jgi:hypothetical protein
VAEWRGRIVAFEDLNCEGAKEILEILHPDVLAEVQGVLNQALSKGWSSHELMEIREGIVTLLSSRGWERQAQHGTSSITYTELRKSRVGIGIEFLNVKAAIGHFVTFDGSVSAWNLDVGIIVMLSQRTYEKLKGASARFDTDRPTLENLKALKSSYLLGSPGPVWCVGV